MISMTKGDLNIIGWGSKIKGKEQENTGRASNSYTYYPFWGRVEKK
jgi:hypothetical protein